MNTLTIHGYSCVFNYPNNIPKERILERLQNTYPKKIFDNYVKKHMKCKDAVFEIFVWIVKDNYLFKFTILQESMLPMPEKKRIKIESFF